MDRENELRKRREYLAAYRAAQRKKTGKKIESREVVKMFGLRVIIGTFDKHNPDTIYYDGTINCEGNSDGVDKNKLRVLNGELRRVFDEWLHTQSVYYTQYIMVVNTLDTDSRYKPKNKHIKFDITVKHLKPHRWGEAVDIAKAELTGLYPKIVNMVNSHGLILRNEEGHNLRKSVSPVTAEPESS